MKSGRAFSFSKLNLANKITLMRIIAIFPVLIFLSYPSPVNCFFATFFFALASLSDILDGYIARRDKAVTNFGKFLDPLADKLLICSVFILLVELSWVPAWLVIIIIIREIAVTGLRAVAADEGIVIAADKYGKLKTIFQSLALGPLIYHYPVFGYDINIIGYILLAVAFALTVYSGYRYFYNFYESWSSEQLLETSTTVPAAEQAQNNNIQHEIKQDKSQDASKTSEDNS